MSFHELHQKLKNQEITSQELTAQCLTIAKKNSHNSFITINEDQALDQAKTADENFKKGSLTGYLQGIPYSLKDLFITKGIRTTAGSLYLSNYIPPYDGFISQKLKQSGAILIGKVGCDEFGMGSTNENTIYGAVKNPINNEFVAGGSSGGSAASVAEASSLFSIGTDTGGSVRLPSNFCGLVGYKPSYGRVSRYGQIAYGSSLDQASPMANSVIDIAIIMKEISANDPHDSTQMPNSQFSCIDQILSLKKSSVNLNGLKIGYVPAFIESCDESVKVSLKKTLDLMKQKGANLIEVALPNLKYSVAVYYLIATSEASANLARYDGIHYGFRSQQNQSLEDLMMNSRSEGLGEEVKKRIMLGTFALSSGYSDEYFSKACKVRRLIYNDFMNAFNKCDIVFSPVCSSKAFKLAEKNSDKKLDPLKMYMNDLYTIPVNLAGLPGLALPVKDSSLDKLPTGFQLIGKPYADEELLIQGRKIEMIINQ